MSGERVPAVILLHPAHTPVLDDSGRVVAPAQREIRDDICIACKLPRDLHYTVSGQKMGCDYALKQGRTPPKNPERWNDPHPAVTCEVLRAMHEDCGPALDILLYNLTHDEKMAIACELGRTAIAAFRRQLAEAT